MYPNSDTINWTYGNFEWWNDEDVTWLTYDNAGYLTLYTDVYNDGETEEEVTQVWLSSPWDDVFLREEKPEEVEPEVVEEYSFVRITFNRKFTWSEREEFRKFADREQLNHWFDAKNPSRVFVEAFRESRELWELVANFVASEYVNVHPRAVRTLDPKVIV